MHQKDRLTVRKVIKPFYRQAVRAGLAVAVLSGAVLFVQNCAASSTSLPVAPQQSDSVLELPQGKLHYQAGRFTAAAEAWNKAANRYEREGKVLNQAVSLSYLSLAHQELGNWELAQRSIAQSLALLKTHTANRRETLPILAIALNSQGKLQLATGKAEAALETWTVAEQTYREANDRVGVLGSRVNQAQALQAMGLYRRAEDLLQAVNDQLRQQPDTPVKLAALRSLGSVWQRNGNLTESQAVLQQSLAIAQQLNQPAAISATLFSLGNQARFAQNWTAALELYRKAAATAPSDLTRLEAQTNQMSLLIQLKQWTDAATLWQQIEPQLTTLAPSRAGIYVQVNLAASWMKQRGQGKENQEPPSQRVAAQLLTALQQARTLQDARAESYALGQLGALYEQTEQWSEATGATQQALRLAQAIGADDVAHRWHWQLGRIFRHQGYRPDAIAAYTESVNLLKSLRRDLIATSPDLQFSFGESVEPAYRELVSLLVQPDRPSQAELRQARDVIEALQLAELENYLRSACLDAKPQQIDDIDRSAAVIYPIILSDRLTTILSIPGQPLTLYSTRISKAQIETQIDKTLESLNPITSDRERLKVSQEVYDWLIRPAEPALKQAKISTLVFVPDGALRNLPMAILHDGQNYLLEKYSLAITSGLQLVAPRSLTQRERLQALIGGLTESRQGFPALPGVATESQQIAAELSKSVILKNETFTQTDLQNTIRETAFPIVHLATHGQFSSKPEETFLLTWEGRLTIEALRSLLQARSTSGSQPIELLVLSACETAKGDQRATLGLAGIAVRSGARSTLATLWAVNDKSTAELMAEFYQALLNPDISRANALRQAQLNLMKNPAYRHPYYWSPFILVGNWL